MINKLFRLLQAAICVGVNAPRIKGMRATGIASEEGAYHPFVALHNDATHQKSWAIFVQVIADLYGCAVRVGEIPAKPLVWCVASHGRTHPFCMGECVFEALLRGLVMDIYYLVENAYSLEYGGIS